MQTTGHLIHIICEVTAYVIGYRYYNLLRQQQGDLISDSDRLWIFMGAALGALIGSHALGVLEKPSDFVPDILYLYGQKTIAGGLIGGLIGVEITKKLIRVHTSSGDLMTYPLMVGMIIGRVGCHFAGLEDGTYGIETALPWGIDLGDGLKRHPVNLYEIIFLLCLAQGISWSEKCFDFSDGRPCISAVFKLPACFVLVIMWSNGCANNPIYLHPPFHQRYESLWNVLTSIMTLP
jgi:phosphatidylglycerol---prolipoprotein diacylglyceryl transferase